jgi:hypothetical protein
VCDAQRAKGREGHARARSKKRGEANGVGVRVETKKRRRWTSAGTRIVGGAEEGHRDGGGGCGMQGGGAGKTEKVTKDGRARDARRASVRRKEGRKERGLDGRKEKGVRMPKRT